jgi:hypothetical protein
VRVKQKVVDAVVFPAVDFGIGCEFEHTLERDRRVVCAIFFPYKTGPHGVVNFE